MKCAVVSPQRVKKTRREGIQLPNGVEIDEASVEVYKYIVVLELDKIMCDKMKRKLMKTHLNGKNLFLALKTWAIYVIRYTAFLDWTKEELWTRKQLIAGRDLHPNSKVMKIYIKRR